MKNSVKFENFLITYICTGIIRDYRDYLIVKFQSVRALAGILIVKTLQVVFTVTLKLKLY